MRRSFCAAIALWPVFAMSAMADTTPIADLRPGLSIEVKGTVTRITDEDEFLLSDGTGEVMVFIGPNAMPVTQSEAIRVIGVVDDDGPLEIYAREIVLSDGRSVAITYRY
jgi:uncharacterized protein YdeI (BOF family)